ncbi:MAG: substrate-binding domain-containing protein [Pseudomonadota bacterium]
MPSNAEDRSILVQSTTSTANAGFYNHILPEFHADTGIIVHVVAVGSGQAIKNASNCDGDVLLVHAKADEEAFVASGQGLMRADVMYNDFVLVGPADDPAAVAGFQTAGSALAQIADRTALFVSRGDGSGTHKKEMELWATKGVDPTTSSGTWYRETGSGMGAALNAAIGMGAYVLTDRATWLTFENSGDYDIVVEGDPALFNQYGVVPVSPTACPNINHAASLRFVNWLLSEAGQRAIARQKIDGRQLFFPNAKLQDRCTIHALATETDSCRQ